MKPELLAAWVTAGAAVVQAIGSIAAIVAGFRIARAAEVRATKVERAALQREEAARAASASREEAVQMAADDRVRRAEADHHNGIIDVVDGLLQSAAGDLSSEIGRLRTDPRAARQMNKGNFESTSIRKLKENIPDLKSKTRDMKIMGALIKLDSDIDRIMSSSSYYDIGPKVAVILANTDRQFEEVRQEFDALRVR